MERLDLFERKNLTKTEKLEKITQKIRNKF